jgi:hypothetical protein
MTLPLRRWRLCEERRRSSLSGVLDVNVQDSTTDSSDQRWLGPWGRTIGARVPKAGDARHAGEPAGALIWKGTVAACGSHAPFERQQRMQTPPPEAAAHGRQRRGRGGPSRVQGKLVASVRRVT